MSENKKHRPFLTYNQQLQKIKSKNVLIDDDNIALEVLKSISYYGIINAYKDIFGTHLDEEKGFEVFSAEVPFKDLHLIALIDNSLNNLLFKYIIYIEKTLKTKVAYNVAKKHGIYEHEYLDFNKYASNKDLDRREVINNIHSQIRSNKNSASVQHYKDEHDCIPPWIAVNALYFGTTLNWYKILRDDMKRIIASEFFKLTNLTDLENQKEFLVNLLSLLHEYRNNIAHGNRTFLSNVTTKLSKTNLFHSIPKEVLSDEEYRNGVGKKDLFAVMIALAILIDNPLLLQQYIYDLATMFQPYGEIETISPAGNVFRTMNIPDNFVERLQVIYTSKFQ
ncbi:TPA: Abi family protein [Streptococcus suis]|nr:Abi family protein [Streptococcus suis]